MVPIFLTLLGIAALRNLAHLRNEFPWHVMYDFPDFYCAGVALDHARSPYTYELLRTCEHLYSHSVRFQRDPALAIPAPLPPYDFPALSALGKLDFVEARTVAAVVITAAVLFSALLLWRLEIPLDVALLALALPGFQELYAGQIVPLALLSVALTGWALARRYDALAGVFAVLTFIEPHLGASVVLSTITFVPRARLTVITSGSTLAFICIAFGPQSLGTYLAKVLPGQAMAEVGFPPQYSLSFVLQALGTPDKTAVLLGSLSFCVMVVAGLLLAPSVARALQRRELLAFIPAATAVMGGVYVHGVELCLALPAAVVLACRMKGLAQAFAAAAVCFLTIPWITAWTLKELFLASTYACAMLLYRLRVTKKVSIAIISIAISALLVLEQLPPRLPCPPGLPADSYGLETLVQSEWHAFVEGIRTHDPLWLAIKVPGWVGLAALLAAVFMGRSTKPALSQIRVVKGRY
jgi:hypothetical protein